MVTLYADAVMNTMSREMVGPQDRCAEWPHRRRDRAPRLITHEQYPAHTGALHFYVHVAEHSPRPQQAEAAADAFGTAGARTDSHLVHMGSHIYKNIGRFCRWQPCQRAGVGGAEAL